MEWVYIPTGAIVKARDGKDMPAALFAPVSKSKGEAEKPAKKPATPKRKKA